MESPTIDFQLYMLQMEEHHGTPERAALAVVIMLDLYCGKHGIDTDDLLDAATNSDAATAN